MSKRKTLAEWGEHLEAAARAGVPLAHYAQTQGLKLQRLYAARHALKRGVAAGSRSKGRVIRPSFIPVRVSSSSVAQVTARLPNGVAVEFVEVDAAMLSGVLSSLARLPCLG